MRRNWGNIMFLIDAGLLFWLLLEPDYTTIAVVITCLSLFRLFAKIGNGSFFLELVYFMTSLTCLLMPVMGFVFFPHSNGLARLWIKYMPVSEEKYFGFLIPAVILLGWAFFLFRKKSGDDASVINPIVMQIRQSVSKISPTRLLLLGGVSLAADSVRSFLPEGLQQVDFFLYLCFFTCMFYMYFHEHFPQKKLVLAFAVAFIFSEAIRYAMFTIVAYMGALSLVLLLAGKKIRVRNKMLLLITGIIFIAFLQLFKLGLRQARKKGQDIASYQIAANVITRNTSGANDLQEILFPIYVRLNQGFNIALVQRRIPAKVDYLNGGYLGMSFASAFVPRFLWPDKPKAGGQENMLIYTGIYVAGWSTNVGPIGEAYGNFGAWGGCLYVFAFGLFLRLCYTGLIILSRKRPTLLLWMPVLFFQVVYVMEADSLQAFNSLIKGAIFLFVMYKLFPSLFPKLSHERQ